MHEDLIRRGFARVHRGRLIPVMRGADPATDPLYPDAPEDITALSDEDLQAYVSELAAAIEEVTANPSEFVTDERTNADLFAETEAAVAALEAARSLVASRAEAEEPEGDPDAEGEEEPEGESLSEAELQANMAELASRARPEETPDPEPVAAVEPPQAEPDPEPVVAAAPAAERRPALRRPARSVAAQPPPAQPLVPLVAAAGGLGPEMGGEVDALDVARMMERKRKNFGHIAAGTEEKVPIARASWSHLYPEERKLGDDALLNMALVAAAVDERHIRAELDRRRAGPNNSLTASGGLCAPVATYYQLANLSTAARPVRAALAAFNADRGGIRFATPAKLTAIGTAVGRITADQDEAGGSPGTKTCQVVACPPFSEVDVAAIFHCIQFGNLPSRTFPELLAQWNELVLAAHARAAETALLDGIGAASTAVTADNDGQGATATLPSQIITAAAGMRSRHRMSPDAVLRVLLPEWVLDLLESDMYRTQFQRFDMNREDFVRLLRDGNVEPSFYMDGQTGALQVFGAQSPGALLPFPSTVVWYMFPEGSFLYIDGGTLELGLVRDSILNATNDFQIFGETWENVAFVGVESLKVTTTVCDSGTVTLPIARVCPTNYA